MTNAFRILLIREDQDSQERPYCTELRERGFELDIATLSSAGPTGGPRSVDVVLLEMLSKSAVTAAETFADRAAAIAGDGRKCLVPILALCAAGFADEMASSAGIDELIHAPFSGARIAGRITALARLTVMRAEMARRLETHARYGLDAPDLAPVHNAAEPAVLVVGGGARLALIENALQRRAGIVGSFTRDNALDCLQRRPFDLVVLDTAVAEAADIIAHLRNNPRHFSLPVVALARASDGDACDILYEAGATDVFLDPVDATELGTRTAGLIREHRLREKLRAAYRQARHLATGDALTGLYGRGFLLQHLDRLLADHARWGQPVTVAALSIVNLAGINATFGYAVGDRIIRQTGVLLGQLARGEELAARWGGGRFALVLAGNRAAAAEAAAGRIRGVVNHTRFSVEDVTVPVDVRLEVGIAEAAAGESGEALVRRALAGADPRPTRAEAGAGKLLAGCDQ